ncbi:hypothetical protein DPMN_015533 [Dreissena polymorpha]|uniref:Uncharacterized protein n=1 Tax=Dreissena polymorpha TaxID=45954 RepID=A0A9D4NDU2_DREPO|nr:hypothetical protein DPMN_015533 [Dreissena polymorpha]
MLMHGGPVVTRLTTNLTNPKVQGSNPGLGRGSGVFRHCFIVSHPTRSELVSNPEVSHMYMCFTTSIINSQGALSQKEIGYRTRIPLYDPLLTSISIYHFRSSCKVIRVIINERIA